MSNKVIHIFGYIPAPEALRKIADAMEAGKYDDKEATLVVGDQIFHAGMVDDERASEQAIFNLTFGIHKLMNPVVSEDEA